MCERTLEQKGRLLEWAEDHPVEFRHELSTLWANAGAGFRENWLNISYAIEQAMEKEGSGDE